MIQSFLLSFGIIILFATVMLYVFTKLKQPPLLAFILTGIVIGPMVLGLVTNTAEIAIMVEIGIAFLLFSVGLGTDLKELKKINLGLILLPIVNIIFTAVIFLILKNTLVIDTIQALYLSFIVSFSSTMLIAKILLDTFKMDSLEGRLTIGILLIEDLIAIIAIPLLKNINNLTAWLIVGIFIKTALLIIIAVILNKIIYPYIIKNAYKSDQSFFLLSIASCFLFILLSSLLDFPIAVGAFFGGLAISIYPYNYEISSKISGIRNLLTTIVFVSLGMKLSFNFSSNLLLLIVLFILVLVIKPIIHFFFVLFSGYGTKTSFGVATYKAQISEFSLILAMQGVALGQLTNGQYSAIIIATSLSMLLTPYLITYQLPIYNYLKKYLNKLDNNKKFTKQIDSLNNVSKEVENHLVIVGSDVTGEAIIKVLGKEIYNPIVIVDLDPDKIEKVDKRRISTICGDVNYIEVFNALNIKKSELIIITVSDFDTTARFIKNVRKENNKVPIFARAHTKKEAYKLYELGAEIVILPKVLESNYLLEKTYDFLKNGLESNNALRSRYMEYLKKEMVKEHHTIRKKESKFGL
ncbi:MAG TPA: cation:proton antiporter [archaeon]|nr:cation:proton antiporter [archaeon]